MPQSYSKIYLHSVFSTRYREPLIPPALEPQLYHFLGRRLIENECSVVCINGTSDHVHLLHSLPRTRTLARIMEIIKSLSSKWIKRQDINYRNFAWQNGYASFSVDYRELDSTRKYVERQKQHHYGNNHSQLVRLTFEEEYLSLLEQYACEYDPEFLVPLRPAGPEPVSPGPKSPGPKSPG